MSFIRCELCDIYVNTPEQLSNHQLGKAHLKKLRSAQFQRSIQGNPSASSAAMDLNRSSVEPRNQVEKNGVSELSAKLSVMKLGLFCNLCEKACNTAEQLEIHKAGSQHQAKLARLRPNALPPEDEYEVRMEAGRPRYHCTVCPNTWCDTLEIFENHRRGVNHNKRRRPRIGTSAADMSFDRSPGGAVSRRIDTSSNYMCYKCNRSLPKVSDLQSHVCQPEDSSALSNKSAWPAMPLDKSLTNVRGNRSLDCYSSSSSDTTSTHLPVAPKFPHHSLLSSSKSSDSSSFISRSVSSATPMFDAAVRDGIVIREINHEYSCIYCGLTCNTSKAMEAHLSGGKHKTKAKKFGKTVSVAIEDGDPPAQFGDSGDGEIVRCAGDMVKCLICDLKLNVNNLQSHLAGKKHIEKKVKQLRTPSCPVSRSPIVRSVWLESWTGGDSHVRSSLKHKPRQYQWELFVKAMKTDTVIYLPTGTGKTMVAALAIGEMLVRNPHYQAVFLVDKALLALQQSVYLREQLGDFSMSRFNWNTKDLESRKPRIACLCGDFHELEGDDKETLWQQDVLVTTVGFYLNLLMSGVVNLGQVCIIVIDEAHHCVKEHPFHRLLKEFYRPIAMTERPKLLGLTASPAGALTIEETQSQLRTLLENLGDIEVAATEYATEELSSYVSSSNTRCVVIPMESLERDLQSHLINLAIDVLALALPNSPHVASLKREMKSSSPNWDVIPSMLEQQSRQCQANQPAVAELVIGCIDSFFKLETGDWELAALDVEKVCSEAAAFENSSMDLRRAVKVLRASIDAIKVSTASGIQISPVMRNLTDTVRTGLRRGNRSGEMIIVLTTHRSIARSVTEYLTTHLNETNEGKIGVTCLVGHGSTSGSKHKEVLGADLTKGMTVQQQRRTLLEISDKKYQVIVATSVAEEGVDLPECGLVILLSPPSTMSAVVQMRGRARRKDSFFVLLCREESQKKKFNLLLMREANMFAAVKDMCREQAERREQ